MNKPEFKNVHNKMYHTKEGTTKWDSRACAVVAHVWFIKNNVPYVLIGKRGQVTDNPNKWNIPCGYLDWNENLQEAMCREVWEETGLHLSKYFGRAVYMKYQQPWLVYSEPEENRQNVAMHMGIIVDIDEEELPPLCLDYMEKNESTGAYWKTIDAALLIPKEEWAFNHLTRFQWFIDETKHLFKH